jgi:ABC-type phosphate/phosphonate transport system substrate-binding protein
MNLRRPPRWCFAAASFLIALVTAPAVAQPKRDPPELKLRLYGSIVHGVNKSEAKHVTQPLCDYVGRQIDQPIECGVHEGSTADDLFEFGKKLNSGEYHVGVIWGLEYGWLREKFPKLKINVVVSSGDKESLERTQLFVRKDSPFNKLADLEGKRLAVYKDMMLMDRVCLRVMLAEDKFDPDKFLVRCKPVAFARSAADAVRGGDADCLVMNNFTYARLRNLQPDLAADLVEIKSGPNYPMPVLVGLPEAVDKLRKKKGLWADLREHFLNVHNVPEGKECANFWRFQCFVAPDDAFLRGVDDLARKLPVKKALVNLD